MPKKKGKSEINLPWWTEELTMMKKETTTRKRRIRCAAPVRRAVVVERYLQAKEKYEKMVKQAQIDSWKSFCEKQDKENVWDGIYRIMGKVTKRTEDPPLVQNGIPLSAQESAKLLAVVFYPEDNTEDDNEHHSRTRELAAQINDGPDDGDPDPPFTLREVLEAADSFNVKKAPGADGFTADICKQVIHEDPELYLSLANKCLELGHFPTTWKEATVVVLRKPGKEDYTHPKSYRPIGLLPVMGKILEKVVVGRVKWHLLPRMSTRQFGFMPQKSTEDSLYTLINHIKRKLEEKKIVVLVSLDIEGAFDSAWWPAIRVRLSEEECPKNLRRLVDSYFESRRVKVRFAGQEHERGTSKGCVQGSIGGPIFWNLLLDPLLRELDRRGDYSQAFADDIVLVFDGEKTEDVQKQANAALAHVRDWGVKNKLKFAPHKTNAMVLTRKLKYDSPILSMGGVAIALKNEIKILGLTIDHKLTFNQHVDDVCCKAIKFYQKLERAAKVQWGLGPEVIGLLYKAVVEPTILYAASAWSQASLKVGVKRRLDRVQRGFAQKMTKAYRTVSLNSALLLAGILPLDIRLREMALLYETKKGYSRRVAGDREVESPVAFVHLEHPATRVALSFDGLVNDAEVNRNTQDSCKIFTDGSKLEGKVGAALSIWDGDAETKTRKLKLENFCTVYQAELLALKIGFDEAIKARANRCCILSDSRAALETIASGRSLHPLSIQINDRAKILNDANKNIKLFWVKAHAGLVGNERADELAKNAARNGKKKPDYDKCPISFVKRQIRKESLDEWNERYQAGETASVTKLFFPNAVEAYKIIKTLPKDSILTQLFTGHGGFSEYLYRFRCKESPACPCDPEYNESIVHILTQCPRFLKHKFELEQRLDVEIKTEKFAELIENKEHRYKFLEYCKTIVKIVNNSNK